MNIIGGHIALNGRGLNPNAIALFVVEREAGSVLRGAARWAP